MARYSGSGSPFCPLFSLNIHLFPHFTIPLTTPSLSPSPSLNMYPFNIYVMSLRTPCLPQLSLSSLPTTVVPSLLSSPGGCATGGPRVWSSNQEVALFQTLQEALREIDLPETQDLPQGETRATITRLKRTG